MNSALCKRFGIEFPLFAFTHCRDVVAEVTNAGGFGVLGAVGHSPETLEIDLAWIDKHTNGKPYGIDLLIPTRMEDKEGALSAEDLAKRVPESHRRHVASLLEKHGIDASDLWTSNWAHDYSENLREGGAQKLLDVAFAHPIKLFVTAATPPASASCSTGCPATSRATTTRSPASTAARFTSMKTRAWASTANGAH